MTLTINSSPYPFSGKRISYHQIVKILGHAPEDKIIAYTWRSGKYVEQGYLYLGTSVEVVEGMEFEVKIRQTV